MNADPFLDPGVEMQYLFSSLYPERNEVYREINRLSEEARDTLSWELDIPYDNHPRARVDLFKGKGGTPLLVFIHGGYWRSMDKRSFSYLARSTQKLGPSVALLNYPFAFDVGLSGVVKSINRALIWLDTQGRLRLPEFSSIVLAGHSAGGQLAAYAASDSQLSCQVAGCICISGIFDLAPLMKTSLADEIGLTATDIEVLSPIHLAQPNGWMILAVGEDETAGFVENQTHRFAAYRNTLGMDTTLVTIPSGNHYTVLLDLANESGHVLSAIGKRFHHMRLTQ